MDLDEQERSAFHYQYSTYQFEYSRNLIFARGDQMGHVMEALVDRNRVRMDIKMLKTILGRKHRPPTWRRRKLEDWHITVERPSYDLTIFKVHFGKLALKMYRKGECVLRVEAMAQNAEALKCGRIIEKFGILAQRLKAILERFVEALSCMDRCFISDGMLDELPVPSIVGTTRVGGIDFNRPRIQRVVRALQALSVSPGGFTASQLAGHVVRQTTSHKFTYGPRQGAYDLKKFRGKRIVVRIGKSHRYETSPDGLRAISALVLLRDNILRPLVASATRHEFTAGPSHPTELDHHYEALRKEMWSTLAQLGIAA